MTDAPQPALDPLHYRRVMSRFATGVTVVSTVHEGVRYGMTVNSLTSVSLDPLLMLFCCEIDCAFHEPVTAARQWAVSVLAVDQLQAARWFATRGLPGVDQFTDVETVAGPALGLPLVAGSLASFECRTWATYDGGDHTVVTGEVHSAQGGSAADPLLYHASRFRSLADGSGAVQ